MIFWREKFRKESEGQSFN